MDSSQSVSDGMGLACSDGDGMSSDGSDGIDLISKNPSLF